jgi:hypothetical protein
MWGIWGFNIHPTGILEGETKANTGNEVIRIKVEKEFLS